MGTNSTEYMREYMKARRAKNKFEFMYISTRIYEGQTKNSKERGHNPPEWDLEGLRVWMQQQPQLESLLKNYRDSGDSDLSPSVNRLDDEVGYSFDNIELITWKENREIENTKRKRQVIQMDLNGKFIKEWTSLRDAGRELGIGGSCISKVCRGVRPNAGGYKFKYS